MKEALNNSMFITTKEDVERTISNVEKLMSQYFQGQDGHPAIVFVNKEPMISLVKSAQEKNENNQSTKQETNTQ